MKVYNEEEYQQLSGIQHFDFCRRQWALIHIEMQWEENLRTVEGEILHSRAHDGPLLESRGDLLISRGMPVHSREMGINGVCDVVEFKRFKANPGWYIQLSGKEDYYKVTPVEYKREEPKTIDADRLQLVAQAICLEEMMCTQISEGYLYYGATRRRECVKFSAELRTKVKDYFAEMHELYEKRYTPMTRMTKACNACSLKNICLPKLLKQKSARQFIEETIKETFP